jgi:tetratricopeptide (TPR) repeat protein
VIYETGLKLFPDNVMLTAYQAICAIETGDTLKGAGLIDRCLKIVKAAGAQEIDIETGLGKLYEEAKSFDKAEEHFRTALKLDPNNYTIIDTLAFFLIQHNRNAGEADSLSKVVLKVKPGNPKAMYVQGLVSYRNGRYEEALNLLQHAYSKYFVWYPALDRDIKKVRKTISTQKSSKPV